MSWQPIARLLLSDAAAERPVAFTEDGELCTLSMLRRDAAAVAEQLAARSATTAILLAEDTYRFATGLLGALHAGCRLVIPPPSQLTALLAERAPDAAFLCDAALPDAVPDLRLDSDLAGASPPALAPLDAERAQLTFCTSGSTGQPKHVNKRLIHLEREIAKLQACFGAAAAGTQRVEATVANHHIYGILFYVLWPLASGIPMARRPAAHWSGLIPRLGQECLLVSSPAHLTRLDPALTGRRPRLIFSSGGPLPLQAALACREMLGQAPVEVFGSTETGGVAWRRQTDAATPWRPFDGVELGIAPDGGIRVRSDLFDDGFVDMGDRVAFLADGRFALEGRTDRIVKLEGIRVSLDEVEAELRRIPGVADAATLILSGARQAVGAVIIPDAAHREAFRRRTRHGLLREVRQRLMAELPAVALPRRLRLADALPVNSQGKRLHAAVVALFDDEGQRGAPDAAGNQPEIRSWREQDGIVEIDLIVPSDLPCFPGHFPGRPVLPGVVQVDWAIRMARRHRLASGGFAAFRNLKFRRVITPGQTLQLRLSRRGADRFQFEFRNAAELFSSGEIELAAA